MFILQLIILIAVAILVWFQKSGRFLKPRPSNAEHLEYETRNKQGKTTLLYLGIERGVPVPMIIRPQRWYDDLLLSLDLTHEVKLHHELDHKLYMMCDHASAFTHLARKTEIAPLMIDLYNKYSIKKLFMVKDRIYAWLSPDTTDREGFCNDLLKLSDAIGKIENHPLVKRVADRKLTFMHLALFVMGLHILLVLYGASGAAALVADSRSTLASNFDYLMGVAFFPVLAFWLASLIMLFWRTSWIGIVLADFVLIGIAGILFTGTLLVRETNIEMDYSTPDMTLTKVTAMDCQFTCTSGTGKRRRSTYYDYPWHSCSTDALRQALMTELRQRSSRCANNVYVSDLNIAVGPIMARGKLIASHHKWDAQAQVFDITSPGTIMAMPVQSGYLGIPWIDDTRIVPYEDR